jgi:prepilin-type N-terminal cleavage/methylation domain-containing protein
MLRYVKGGNGFSLVEVMIALVVLLLVFMGLMQTALLSIDSNMRNILRDEALRIAAQRMEETRSLPFDSIVSDAAATAVTLPACGNPPVGVANYPVLVERNFRNIQNFPFGSVMGVTDLDPGPDTKMIQVTVRWEYRNECYTHTVSSVRRR